MKEKKIPFDFINLPQKKGTCSECGTKHYKYAPHEMESIYYHVTFFRQNGRYPTWDDATAHCSDAMKKALIKRYKELGRKINIKKDWQAANA